MKLLKFLLGVIVVMLSVGCSRAEAQEFAVTINAGGTQLGSECLTSRGQSGFDVQYFALGGTDSVNMGSGGGSGKVTLGPLTVHKQFNTCSEDLLRLFLQGRRMKQVTLTEYRTVGSSKETVKVMEIDLIMPFISDYEITNNNVAVSSEVIQFVYSAVCISSTPMRPDGTPGNPVKVCYNAATNTVM